MQQANGEGHPFVVFSLKYFIAGAEKKVYCNPMRGVNCLLVSPPDLAEQDRTEPSKRILPGAFTFTLS